MWSAEELWQYWLRNANRWWSADSAFRRECRRRFMLSCTLASEGAYDHWRETLIGSLGLILLFHSLPRQLFHKLPMAYDQDKAAGSVALNEIALQRYLHGSLEEQFWLVQPLSHSEKSCDQKIALDQCDRMMRAFPELISLPQWQPAFQAMQARADIIARFGRFPERNEILERRSTPDEATYLAGEQGILRV